MALNVFPVLLWVPLDCLCLCESSGVSVCVFLCLAVSFCVSVSRAAPASRQQNFLLFAYLLNTRRPSAAPLLLLLMMFAYGWGGVAAAGWGREPRRLHCPSWFAFWCRSKWAGGVFAAQNKETFPVCCCFYRSLLLIFVLLVVPAIVVVVVVVVDNSPNF